ncbi:MAG: FtsX-like permease family protein [Bacteroidota bacterium]
MKKVPSTPPKYARKFLRWFLKPELEEEVLGDLEEKFYQNLEERALFKARLNYWYQTFNYLRPFAIKNTLFTNLNPLFMFRHHFKISLRTLWRDKGFSLINIGGLALGMAVAMLIGLWIWDELSFNKNYENYEQIAQVMQHQTFDGTIETHNSQARQVGPVLEEAYGNQFKHVVMSSYPENILLEFEETKLNSLGYYMDEDAPDLFSLKMVAGTRDALVDPSSILLAESLAKALFGEQNPMNQTLIIDNGPTLKVGGVHEDIPFNADLKEMKFVAAWDFYVSRFNLIERTGWVNNWFQTFVQIDEQVDMATASLAIKDAKKRNVEGLSVAKFDPVLFLHPMSKWHLHTDFRNGANVGGRIQYVRLFGVVGLFVLLLACINFMNLSTARSERRAREVGVRKAIGSQRSQLISQFFSESLLVTGLALVLAIGLVFLTLPTFNEMAEKQIVLPLTNSIFLLTTIGFTILTGLISGIYPALYLSAFQPVKVLKGTFKAGKGALLPRKVLVVTQFTVSTALIIGTIIVFQQVQYVKNRPIGYNNNNLLSFSMPTNKMNQQFAAVKSDLLNTGLIESVSKSDLRITDTRVTNSGYVWEGKDPNMSDEFVTVRVSHDFGKTMDWKVIEGRDFDRKMTTDSTGFVINEAAVKYMGLENPVGQTIQWGDIGQYQIIGVVEDMITQNPYQPVKQTIFYIDYRRSKRANVKIKATADMNEAVAAIGTVFAKYDPANTFDYNFADEDYDRKFRDEVQAGQLASFFTILAIIISCLGVFGLAAYMAERRTKEIGIRKVLGASVSSIWRMLSKDFVILAIIACLLAIPLAHYFAQDWLATFDYRMTISWSIFALAGVGILLITLLTVSFQAIRAAFLNPIQALKTE